MNIEWEPVERCPVCGGKGKPIIKNNDTEIKDIIYVDYCRECRCAYHNPRMSQKSIAEYYNSGAYREHPSRAHTERIVKFKKAAVGYKILMLEGFRSNMGVKINRSLDYGCGRGYLVDEIKKTYGEDVIGYDIYRDPNATIDIVTNKDEITGKFDLITCVHTLEHLPDPMSELDWMISKLNKDGLLFIEIPFARVVFPPHPIMFSRESVYRMMMRLKARYIFYDMEYINGNGLIYAQPNHPSQYDSPIDYYTGSIAYFRIDPILDKGER